MKLNLAVTLGTLWIEGSHQYTVSATSGGSLTFDTTAASALLNVSGTAAAQTIATPVALNVPLVVNQRATGDLTFSKPVSGSFQITKTGEGAMVLAAGNTAFSGGFNVAQGLLRTASGGALGSGDVTLSGGSLGWRGSSSTAFTNNVNVTADGALWPTPPPARPARLPWANWPSPATIRSLSPAPAAAMSSSPARAASRASRPASRSTPPRAI